MKWGSKAPIRSHPPTGRVNIPQPENRPTDLGKGKKPGVIWVRPAPAKEPLSV